jgi:hypothetical protein
MPKSEGRGIFAESRFFGKIEAGGSVFIDKGEVHSYIRSILFAQPRVSKLAFTAALPNFAEIVKSSDRDATYKNSI